MTKHFVDRMASRIWYQAVEDGLGLNGPIAVELSLEGDRVKPEKDGIKRPRKWKKFCLGTRTPPDIPGTLNVYDIAERKAPGTSRWFRTPMWKALKGEYEHPEDLLMAFRGLPALRRTVISESEPFEFAIPARGILPAIEGSAPFVKFATNRIGDCINLDGLDLLEAVVFVLEYGYLTRTPSITERSLNLYKEASPKICEIPALRYTFEQFFGAVEGKYTCVVDLEPEDIFPPWHVRMPELTQKIYDIDAMRKEALAWDDESGT